MEVHITLKLLSFDFKRNQLNRLQISLLLIYKKNNNFVNCNLIKSIIYLIYIIQRIFFFVDLKPKRIV